MKVPYGEGVAIHTGPESCGDACEGMTETLTGDCVGQLENLPRGEKRTKLCNKLFKITALDFSGIDFSEIESDQVSDNSTTNI